MLGDHAGPAGSSRRTLWRVVIGPVLQGSIVALLLCGHTYAGHSGVRGKALLSDDAPDWLRSAAAVTVPGYDKSVPAVVLLDQGTDTVDQDGKVTSVSRYVIKILTAEGKKSAIARAIYNTDTEKVRDLQAWLIRPSGAVKHFHKDDVQDSTLTEDSVYDEAREKRILGERECDIGSVFGFETIIEKKSIFTQFYWWFQSTRAPVVTSTLTLNLPAGWTAESKTFNHANVEPTVNGSTYRWELRDLPFVPREPMSPGPDNVAPLVAISYFPSDSAHKVAGPSFSTWEDVSRWLSELSDPQIAPNDALTTKAQSLAAGATTELDRIKAIAEFVQAVHYVSIQIGEGRGGGYRPHPATQVFAKSYGDCKDKANLMRAMLKVVGITAYPVAIYSGDPYFVHKEWPSPHQFNHCIIAIKVGDTTQAATIITHGTLGRLLIFDPTDPYTPVGDLPDDEQGSYALIVAADGGALMRMPQNPPEANLRDRHLEATLSPDGSILGVMNETSRGQAAVSSRAELRLTPRADYTKIIEQWVSTSVNGATVSKVDPVDNQQEGHFSLAVDFAAQRYAQIMQGRLLIFKPAIISRRESVALPAAARGQPIILESDAYKEEARIKLPDGFDVDELPDPVKLETEFGSFSTSYSVKNGYLLFEQSISLRAGMIPPRDYQSVRTFFERIRAAEQSPAVLARK